jgi:hypothetical protein
MADKNSKNGADETDAHIEGFDEVDWGGDDAVPTPAPAASSKASLFDEDDPFSDSAEPSAENFFEIEQMPDATSSDDGFGGDDFGDLQSDGDDAPASAPVASTAGHDEDPFADDPFGDDDGQTSHGAGSEGDDDFVDDPFADVSETSASTDEETAPASAPASSGQGVLARHRSLLLGVVGVAAAAIAVVYGAPMFLGGGPAISVTQPAPIQSADATFPTVLPTQNVAGHEVAQAKPPLATIPSLPTPELADAQPAVPATPSQPSLTIDLPTAPSLGIPKDATIGQATAAINPLPARTDVAKADPVDDLVGGSDRGGIDAVKSASVATVAPSGRDYGKDIDALISRLDTLEGKVEQLADGFDKVVQSKASTVDAPSGSQMVEVPAAASSDAVPPMKPPIVEAASLKGVAGDMAWVSTKSGVVEVRVGDVVPNAGKVVAIRNYRDQWIVVTTDGLIVRQ